MSNEYDACIKHLTKVISTLKKNEDEYSIDISTLELLKLKLVASALARKPLIQTVKLA